MDWFGRSRKHPGWMAISLAEDRLSFVHGRTLASGKPAITRYGTAEIEPKPKAAERLAKELRLDRYQCATFLSPGEYQMLVVEAPNVPQAELKDAMRWRVKDMIDYPIEQATMDVLDIPPESDLVGRGHSMYAVAARSDVIQLRIKAFEDAGIRLSVIDIPEIAQRNISALHEPEERGAALLYFNDEFGLLTITCQGELYFARRIDIGLSQMLGRPADSRDELFGRIVLELQRTFDHFDRQFRYVPVAKVLLGPERGETGLIEHLKANLELPVERVDLPEHLAFTGEGVPDLATQWQLFHLIGASLRNGDKAS